MDIKQIWNYYLVVIFLLVFHKGICFEEDYDDSPNFGRCPWIRNKLKNGRVKIRSRGRIAKFLCDSGYELAGKRFATCVRGQWNNPIPVCVARGCPRTPATANGRVTEMYRGAMLVYDCNPGYSLDGVVSIYCDGRKWSTDPPACVGTMKLLMILGVIILSYSSTYIFQGPDNHWKNMNSCNMSSKNILDQIARSVLYQMATSDPEIKCDFEDPEMCGWSNDPTHDFDWKRNQFSTPSGHVGTGPLYDHTFGYDRGGFYLYLEASSPRKENDKARLFSPVYPPDDSDSCFVFWYHMFGANIGTLNLYLKPESHVFSELSPKWEKSGDFGERWIRGKLDIPAFNENFQIVIEGIRGDGYIGDISIDDFQLMKQHCEDVENATDGMVSHTIGESCRGRCGRYRERGDNSSCGCSNKCQLNDTCCNDYATLCVEDSDFGKTSTTTIMTATNDVSMEPSYEPASLPSSSRDVIRSSPVNETTSSITTSMAPVTFNLSTTSSTSVATLITLPTMESNSTSSSNASSQLTSISVTVSSPSTTNNSSKPPREEAVPETSTSSSTILTTTIQTTTTASTVKSTTTTTTVKPSTSTTTIKPIVTTEKTTAASTTVKPIAGTTNTLSTTSVTKNITTSNGTTEIATIQTDTTKVSDIIVHTRDINIPPFLSTTVSTVYTTTGNNSEEPNIPDMHSNQTDGTIVSSSSESSSITSTSSTRKTYNLRPRTQRTTSTASTYSSNITGVTYIPATNTLPNTVVTDTTSARTSSKSSYGNDSRSIPYVTFVTKSTQSSSRTSHLNMPTTFYPRTTRKFTFGIRVTTKNTLSDMTTTDSSLNHASKEASTADKDSQPTVAIVAVSVAVIAFAAGGLMYYLKKQKDKRRSKLSDDSEMRFLSDNEEMEYSDASVLDKILIK